MSQIDHRSTLRREALVRVKRYWVTLSLILVAIVMCVSNVAQSTPQFSPYDEWVFYDYVTKVPSQLFVKQGEEIGETALEAMACHGDGFGPRGEPCTGPDGVYDEPELYPQQGITSADPYTPLYFATTWAGAKGIELLTGADLLTSSRAFGMFWLIGGLIPLVLLFREFRLSPVLQLGLGLTFLGLTTTHYAFTYISTDAPSLLIGSTLALMAVRFAKTGRYPVWLAVVSAIAVWLKITNVFAVGFAALALLLVAIRRHRIGHSPTDQLQSPPGPKRLVVVAGAMALTAVCAELLWLVLWKSSSLASGPDQGITGDLSIKGYVRSLFAFLVPREGIDVGSSWQLLVGAPYFALVIVGVIGWFAAGRKSDALRPWSTALLVSATLFAPAMMLAMQIILGSASPMIPRYGASLTPMFLVAIAMVMRSTVSQWLLLAYGAGLSALNIVGLIY